VRGALGCGFSASLNLAGISARRFLLSLFSCPEKGVHELEFVAPCPRLSHRTWSVLSSSKRGLVYLTANDWTLVADKRAGSISGRGRR